MCTNSFSSSSSFSVLISVYYKESSSFLKESLISILNQTVVPNEIVIVKDGKLTESLDNCIDTFISNYPLLFKIVSLPTNQGLGVALNEGLKHCSCEIVARMDADDVAKPDRFTKQLAVFEQYPDIDVVGAWVDEFEGDVSNVVTTRTVPEWHKDIVKYASKRCPINHPVVMFKKQSVIDAGGYQHCPSFEDYYLWVRMMNQGSQFYNIQEGLLYFRFSPDMVRRRGGWDYIKCEYGFQKRIRNIHFISSTKMIRNMFVRFCVRAMPTAIRRVFYKKVLRY